MTDRNSNFGDFRKKLLFVGIGAQNSGTTWLYSYLREHPKVYMSPIKELHYFDMRFRRDRIAAEGGRFVRRLHKKSAEIHYADGAYRAPITLVDDLLDRIKMDADEGEYREFFRRRVKNEIVFGEITPSYAILPKEGFRRIREQHENVKLIFLMKDPIERFWSRVRKSAKRANKNGGNVRAEDLFFFPDQGKKRNCTGSVQCNDRKHAGGFFRKTGCISSFLNTCSMTNRFAR